MTMMNTMISIEFNFFLKKRTTVHQLKSYKVFKYPVHAFIKEFITINIVLSYDGYFTNKTYFFKKINKSFNMSPVPSQSLILKV